MQGGCLKLPRLPRVRSNTGEVSALEPAAAAAKAQPSSNCRFRAKRRKADSSRPTRSKGTPAGTSSNLRQTPGRGRKRAPGVRGFRSARTDHDAQVVPMQRVTRLPLALPPVLKSATDGLHCRFVTGSRLRALRPVRAVRARPLRYTRRGPSGLSLLDLIAGARGVSRRASCHPSVLEKLIRHRRVRRRVEDSISLERLRQLPSLSAVLQPDLRRGQDQRGAMPIGLSASPATVTLCALDVVGGAAADHRSSIDRSLAVPCRVDDHDVKPTRLPAADDVVAFTSLVARFGALRRLSPARRCSPGGDAGSSDARYYDDDYQTLHALDPGAWVSPCVPVPPLDRRGAKRNMQVGRDSAHAV
jgi:hypothetical protein